MRPEITVPSQSEEEEAEQAQQSIRCLKDDPEEPTKQRGTPGSRQAGGVASGREGVGRKGWGARGLQMQASVCVWTSNRLLACKQGASLIPRDKPQRKGM